VPIIALRAAPPAVKYQSIPLIAAPLPDYVPPPPPAAAKFTQPVRVAKPAIIEPPKHALKFDARIVAPKPAVNPPRPVEAPSVGSFAPKAVMASAAPVVRRPVETGVMASGGSSAAPTLSNRPASQVQTGGFGDPNGVAASGKPNTRAANINTAGSFDLPGGPGYGNGTGGAKGARGTIASAGFGNGVATAAPPAAQRSVQSSGFGDAAASGGSNPASKPREVAPARIPVEVIAKPNPVYTEEARKLRLEGDVKLRVIFHASGELEIVGVTQGLGHGLDEAAVAAARKIRFKPAQENGHPVDQPATITIEFKLAY
jgi:TonB family protein